MSMKPTDKQMKVKLTIEVWRPKGIGKQETHWYLGGEYLFGINDKVENPQAKIVVEALNQEIKRLLK